MTLRPHVTHNGNVDLVVGAERRLAGHGDGGEGRGRGRGGQVLLDVEAPELTTNLLHRHTLYNR